MNRYGEYFATKEEYIRKYRFANAFHPFHGFSMMSCGHLAEEHTSAIYIVGAREPGIARGMGLKTRATFEEALADAMRKYTGPNPNILALPRTFTTAAVHLCMKDPALNSAPVAAPLRRLEPALNSIERRRSLAVRALLPHRHRRHHGGLPHRHGRRRHHQAADGRAPRL